MPPAQTPDYFSLQIAEAKRFYLELKPSGRTALAVVSGGCEHCAADYVIRRSSFPYFSIEFVAQGKGTLHLQGRRHDLMAGTLFAYGPGIPHLIRSDPQERLVKYFVDFAGREAGALLRAHAPKPGRLIQTSGPGEVMALFDTLIREGLRNTPYTGRIAALLVRQLALKAAETALPAGSASSPAFATYCRCKQHLEQHWTSLHTLDAAAAACHVNASHLCRLFQRFGHQSPYQYLLRLKMNHAAQQLQVAGAAVKAVADSAGFSDPFHFSRVFKSVMGVSPSQFARLGHSADAAAGEPGPDQAKSQAPRT